MPTGLLPPFQPLFNLWRSLQKQHHVEWCQKVDDLQLTLCRKDGTHHNINHDRSKDELVWVCTIKYLSIAHSCHLYRGSYQLIKVEIQILFFLKNLKTTTKLHVKLYLFAIWLFHRWSVRHIATNCPTPFIPASVWLYGGSLLCVQRELYEKWGWKAADLQLTFCCKHGTHQNINHDRSKDRLVWVCTIKYRTIG